MDSLPLIRNAAILVVSYLIGAIPFCNLIAKIHSGKDLRKIGEKNPGSVNLMVNVSKAWGVIGGILDFLKGAIAYFFAFIISGSFTIAVLAGVAAILGHNYSPYLKFSGGKGMSTTVGVFFAANPFSILVFGAVFLLFLVLLKNIIWGIITAMLGASIFIYLLAGSNAFLLMFVLMVLAVIPKYMTFSKKVFKDFRVRRDISLKDLMYEQDRPKG